MSLIEIESISWRNATEIEVRIRAPGAVDEIEPDKSCPVELRKEQDPHHLVFRLQPDELYKTLHIPFRIRKHDHSVGGPYILEKHDLNLPNPFERPGTPRENKREIAERKGLFAKFDQSLRDCPQPQSLIIGSPGTGKSTFLYQWRRSGIKNARNNKIFPIILIAACHDASGADFHEFVWQIDKAIYEDLRSYEQLLTDICGPDPENGLPEILKAVGQEFGSFKFIDTDKQGQYEKPGDDESFSRELYSTDPLYYHTSFMAHLRRCIKKLNDTLVAHGFSARVVLVIDDVPHWKPEKIGWLFTCFRQITSKHVGAQIVIALSNDLDISFFGHPRGMLALRTRFPRYKPELDAEMRFFLPPLGEKQLKRILEDRLPQLWRQTWWDDNLVGYLQRITGGNAQAVESVLFHWWENLPWKQDNTESWALRPDQAPIDKQKNLQVAATRAANDSSQLTLCRLWDKHFYSSFTLRIEDYATTLHYLGGLTQNMGQVLNDPQRLYPLANWQSKVLSHNQSWRSDIVRHLVDSGLVRRKDHSYRLEIPVLGLIDRGYMEKLAERQIQERDG